MCGVAWMGCEAQPLPNLERKIPSGKEKIMWFNGAFPFDLEFGFLGGFVIWVLDFGLSCGSVLNYEHAREHQQAANQGARCNIFF